MSNKIKILLEKYNITPNKVLGQNFLIDKKYIIDLIASAEISSKDVVIEVGPGTGGITQELAKKAKKVIAVEKDPRLVKLLKDEFANHKNVEIVEDDILKFSIYNLQSANWRTNSQARSYKLVGAIPYYLTARLFRKFLENTENPPKLIAVIIPKKIAEKITARPPKTNLLAISVQIYGKTKLEKQIPSSAFWPKPKINSAILTVKNIEKPKTNEEELFRAVKAGFSSPRKQLAKNLSKQFKIPRADIENTLKTAGLDISIRAEALHPKDWLKLAELLRANNLN
ncbi:MAG: 16S rRNA (adenine(1518)-N(6)/adenine(1519)-N(6))-dimethyltransferase RsmA [Candidatus Spechtbacterales bacterium]